MAASHFEQYHIGSNDPGCRETGRYRPVVGRCAECVKKGPRRVVGIAREDIRTISTRLSDAVANHDTATAARILTEHLGDLMLHDAIRVRDAAATFDIRMVSEYPVLAVAHPDCSQLCRIFPPDLPSPQFTLRNAHLEWVYVMAFARESGRIKMARAYADRISRTYADPPEKSSSSSRSFGHAWLVWSQLGLTGLAAGEIQEAAEDFITALKHAQSARCDDSSSAVKLTFGYRALVAVLLGETAAASSFLARARDDSESIGSFGWSLCTTARALIDVEEHAHDSEKSIELLDLIDDRTSFWPFVLLAQTRYSEIHGLATESLALIEHAEARYSPELGSFAYDVVVARRIEVLVILGRLAEAREVLEDRAAGGPHCQLARLALLLGERDYLTLEREVDQALMLLALTPAQRVQAQALRALGFLLYDGTIPGHLSPGVGFSLAQRRHRRIALMFPPMFRVALTPFMTQEAIEEWERSKLSIRQWTASDNAGAFDLSGRELALLRHIDQGLSYQEIAAREHRSINTVKTQLKSLYKKLGVSTRAEAAASGHRLHLLD